MGKWMVMLMMSTSLSVFSQGTYDTIPNRPDYYRVRVEKFRKEVTPSGKTVFVGDETIERGNWRKLLKDSTVLNRGIAGDKTFGVMQRLDEIIKHKPARVFLTIGINDLAANTPNEVIIENIFAIVGKVRTASSKTVIYVQGIMPVNPTLKSFPKDYSRQENIIEINKQLSKYSEALKYNYLDMYTHFIDRNSLLDARFTPDGLHLNANGYVHWVEFLKKGKYL